MPAQAATAPHDPEVQTSQVLQQAADGIKIAWRYKGQVAEKMLGGSDALADAGFVKHAHYFDLSKTAPAPSERVRTLLKGADDDVMTVWNKVEAIVKSFTQEQIASQATSVPILRIVFLGFGSGLWEQGDSLLSVLHRLHSLSRHSLVHCLVAMPKVVVNPAVRHCFDHSVSLSEFVVV